MDFEFLKERYNFELARKEDLTAALPLPVGVLTGLGGIMAAMGQSIDDASTVWTWLFLVPFASDVAAFVVALVFLAYAYHGQDYGYLPRLGELQADQEEIYRYFGENGGDDELARAEFQRQLERRMIEAADRNATSNDRRAAHLHRARQCLLGVLVLTFAAGFVFVLARLE